METPHYNDPYGYFILHTASCAGSTRATGLCLNWICDPFGLYCGPEEAPYEHPYLY